MSSHTFKITCGSRSGLLGYWDGNIGSITNATYQLPNGSNATIRQCMSGSPIGGLDEVRFLLNQAGLTASDTDQFPLRLEISRGSLSTTLTPQNPDQIQAFGQGIGRDYIKAAGAGGSRVDQIFANNTTVTVVAHYTAATTTTTAQQTFYRRGRTSPSKPTAQTGTPSGWQTTNPGATTTENVYSVVRTQTLTNNVVTSASYGSVMKIADANPSITTATQTFYRRAASTPSKPTDNTGTPSGWSTSNPGAIVGQGVYRVIRTQTLTNGVVTSATYGTVTRIADPLRPDPVITTATQTFYRRGRTSPSKPTAQTGTPSDWSTNRLTPTATDNVYSVERTQTLTNGVVTSASYGSVMKIADAVPQPPDPTGYTDWQTYSITDRPLIITGLENDKEYEFQIRGVNNIGPGPITSATATPRQELGNTPEQIEDVTVISDDRQGTVNWIDPNGGGQVQIRYRRVGTDRWTETRRLSATYEYLITGLTNGVQYEVQVLAWNEHGVSPWSDPFRFIPSVVRVLTTIRGIERERLIVFKFEHDTRGLCSGGEVFTLPRSTNFGEFSGLSFDPYIQISTELSSRTMKDSGVEARLNVVMPPDVAVAWAGKRRTGELVQAVYLERSLPSGNWEMTLHGFIAIVYEMEQQGEGAFGFTFLPMIERVTKQDPEIWSDHAHQSRYPGDTWFSNMADLASRGRYVKFP